jgi:hypothetical protein
LAMIVGVETLVGCVNESEQKHDLLNWVNPYFKNSTRKSLW